MIYKNRFVLSLCFIVALGATAAALLAAVSVQHGVRDASTPLQLEQPRRDKLLAIAEDGKPIVEAIYRFKDVRGLWPCCLADLMPAYLKVEQTRGWELEWRPSGWWQLTNYGGLPLWAVRYSVGGNEIGWVVTDGEYTSSLGTEQLMPPPVAHSEQEIRNVQFEELERRTKLEPPMIVHHKGLVSLHYKRHDLDQAWSACKDCLRRWPDHWWPNVMLARIENERGDAATAEARLRKWVKGHRDFTHVYFLVDFLYRTGQKEKAHAALKDAAKYPLADNTGCPDDGEVIGVLATSYSWKGAMMAYREEWFDALLAICDQWEKFDSEEDRHTGDGGYYAIRCAFYLNQGEFEKAADQLSRVRKQLGDRNYGWNRNLDVLERAINAKDKSCRYAPKELSSELVLLIDYQ